MNTIKTTPTKPVGTGCFTIEVAFITTLKGNLRVKANAEHSICFMISQQYSKSLPIVDHALYRHASNTPG